MTKCFCGSSSPKAGRSITPASWPGGTLNICSENRAPSGAAASPGVPLSPGRVETTNIDNSRGSGESPSGPANPIEAQPPANSAAPNTTAKRAPRANSGQGARSATPALSQRPPVLILRFIQGSGQSRKINSVFHPGRIVWNSASGKWDNWNAPFSPPKVTGLRLLPKQLQLGYKRAEQFTRFCSEGKAVAAKDIGHRVWTLSRRAPKPDGTAYARA